ncbi:MAG: outer membrane beta-barrel protein [Vicinamibacterales bacterium]
MMKVGFLALCVCAVPQIASAQTMQWTDKGYVSVNGGVEVGSGTLRTTSTFSIYGEQASVTTTSSGKTDGLFDVGGAYRVWGRNLLAGVFYTHASSSSNGTINASIPDPIQFDDLRPVTESVGRIKHRENQIHLDAVWMMPIAEKLDVGLQAGPTIFILKQANVNAVAVTEPAPTVSATVGTTSKTTAGVNVGADLQYLVWHTVALGGVARYTWGRTSVGGSKLTLGGFQIEVGARYRF